MTEPKKFEQHASALNSFKMINLLPWTIRHSLLASIAKTEEEFAQIFHVANLARIADLEKESLFREKEIECRERILDERFKNIEIREELLTKRKEIVELKEKVRELENRSLPVKAEGDRSTDSGSITEKIESFIRSNYNGEAIGISDITDRFKLIEGEIYVHLVQLKKEGKVQIIKVTTEAEEGNSATAVISIYIKPIDRLK